MTFLPIQMDDYVYRYTRCAFYTLNPKLTNPKP